MRILGIIEIPKMVLQDEEIANLLLDGFDILDKEDCGSFIRMTCTSAYFDDLEDGESIPGYHVDLKRDQENVLYIWQVTRVK
jgi:hypothetical protein